MPWIKDKIKHRIAGGVDPGEGHALKLSPNPYDAEWNRSALYGRDDLTAKAALTSVTFSDGKKLLHPTRHLAKLEQDLQDKKSALAMWEEMD